MFSSHTIYTLSFILGVWKYWPNKYGVAFMICIQIAIVFLIIASRKHYTLDVFTALYVVPLFWFIQDAYLKDINHKDVTVDSKTIYDFYGIDVSADLGEVASPSVPLDSVQVSTVEAEFEAADSNEHQPRGSFHRKGSM
jgi:hypothetical protein